MQQYFENRTSVKWSGLELRKGAEYEKIIVANERIDKNWKSEKCVINN